jgi:DNA replication protein DnaC
MNQEERQAWMRERTVESIPERFRWAEFGAAELQQWVKPARFIAAAQSAVDSTSVVLLGNADSGKTSLGCALLRASADKRRKIGMFVSTFELAKARREQRLGHGEAELIERAQTVGVLLLDELCAELGVDTAVDEVIRARWDHMRPTIYTCGFSQDAIRSSYGDGVARRILGGSTVLTLGGR